jgi:hypothetical protein
LSSERGLVDPQSPPLAQAHQRDTLMPTRCRMASRGFGAHSMMRPIE